MISIAVCFYREIGYGIYKTIKICEVKFITVNNKPCSFKLNFSNVLIEDYVFNFEKKSNCAYG